MSATGVLLTYQKQIVAWSERDYRAAPPSADALRLPIDELVARVVAARPETVVTGVTVRSDREAPLMVALAPAGMAFVNPYTGAGPWRRQPGCARLLPGCHRVAPVAGHERRVARYGPCNHRRRQPGIPAAGDDGRVPLDSTRVVARVGPRRALVSWWPERTRARLQLAQHDWRLVGRAALPDRHKRRRDVLSLGECAGLPGDRQRAAGAAAAPCDATARAAAATGGLLGSRPADRARAQRRCPAGSRSPCDPLPLQTARSHWRSIEATARGPTNARPSSSIGPGMSSAGSRMRRRMPVRKRARGCASCTPAKPAASSARPSPDWPRPGPSLLVYTGLALACRRFLGRKKNSAARAAAA